MPLAKREETASGIESERDGKIAEDIIDLPIESEGQVVDEVPEETKLLELVFEILKWKEEEAPKDTSSFFEWREKVKTEPELIPEPVLEPIPEEIV
jgi:hypothetical protein